MNITEIIVSAVIGGIFGGLAGEIYRLWRKKKDNKNSHSETSTKL
jgi:hypothetical protein